MFHVAPVSRRAAIRLEGLRPDADPLNPDIEPRGVYVWDDFQTALKYMGQGPNMYRDFDVHEVDVSDLDLQRDPWFDTHYPDRAKDFPGGFYTTEKIPPERIRPRWMNPWFPDVQEATYAERLHPRDRLGRWRLKLDLLARAGRMDPGSLADGFEDSLDGFSHGGLTMHLSRTEDAGGWHHVQWDIETDDPGRPLAGDLDASLNAADGTVSLNLMHVYGEHQGRGFATALFQHQVKTWREMGFRRIKVDAGLSVGGYAWAALGFGWDEHFGRNEMGARAWWVRNDGEKLDAAQEMVGKRRFSDKKRLEFEKWLLDSEHTNRSPQEIASYGIDDAWEGTINGVPTKMWLGKAIMLGSSWEGQYPLDDQDAS
jgi:GNAT superfamily N-acetyltransferase